MKFSIKNFFSKCDQICGNLRIWLHFLKKSLMENFIFCSVIRTHRLSNIPQQPYNWLFEYTLLKPESKEQYCLMLALTFYS